MANSDKNIRITTSKNKTTYPNIVFTGSAAGSSVITLEVLDDNTLSFTSNEGQVFSIDSNLSTGTIWAVSDISGIPLLSASAGGTIGLGVYGGIVAIGQTNPTYKLDLKGSFGLASANDGLYNFIFSNNAASGSNNFQVRSANSILLYNSGNSWYTGLKSNAAANVTYTLPTTDGSPDQFLKTNGSGVLSWGTPTGGSGGGSTGVGPGAQYEVAVYPGTGSSVLGYSTLKNNFDTGVVSISHTTASLNYTNGAFTVSGGVGIGGSLFVGGIGASISGVTFANSIITKGAWNGTVIATQYGGTGQDLSGQSGILQVSSGTVSAITTSSSLRTIISDEIGGGSLVFNSSPSFGTGVTTGDSTFAVFNTNALTINAFGAATSMSIGAATGKATFNSTDNSTNSTTGGLVVSGGAGFAKSVSIAGRLQLFNGSTYTAFVSNQVGTGSTVYVLPTTTPATGTSVLQSDIAGVLSWVPMVASSSSSTGGTVYAGTVNQFAFYGATGNTVGGSVGITYNPTAGVVSLTHNTVSTSTTSGALTIVGGVGIGGSLFTGTGFSSSISGVILANNTINASTYNKIIITAPASSATLTLADGSTLATSGANSLTLATTAPTSVTLPSSGTLVNTAVTSLASLTTATSLNSVGTITSGTWSATAITGFYGGTGHNSYNTGDILVGAGSTFIKLNSGSTNLVLTSNGLNSVPSWQSVPPSAASSVAVTPTTLGQSFFVTTVSSSSGSGLGLSTIVSFTVNPNTNIVSVSGLAVTAVTATTSSTTGALTVAGGAGIANSAFIGGMLRVGSNTFSKSYSLGDVALDNGSAVDTPAVTYYWGNFTNFGTDVYSDGVGSTRYRVVYNLNENGGREVFTIDTNGNVRLYNNSGTNYFGFKFTGVATTTYTLPASTPAGTAVSVLQSDQAGNMSWVAMAASSASGTVNSGNANFAAYYASSTNAVSENVNLIFTGTGLSVGGFIQSSSTLTGSLQVKGGIGITGNAFIGGTTVITNTLVSTSTNSGALTVSGGVGIGGSLFTGTGFSSSISGVILANNTINASTYNKVTITAPASSATLTLADGSTLATSGANSLTLATTAPTSVTLPTSGTLVNTAVTSLSSLTTATSLNSVGTITSGTWSATAITGFYGGTGHNSYNTGDILVGAGSTFIKLNSGSTNLVLTSNGLNSVPSWQAVPASSASSVAVTPTALGQIFYITTVSASSGSGLGLSTIVSFGINPQTGLVYASGIAITGGTNSISTITGSLTAGGLGITGNAFIGGTTTITSNQVSLSSNSGALVVTGGVGIGGSLYTSTGSSSSISGVILANGNLSATTVNKLTLTAPASSATLTLANGSSLITSGAFSLTFTTSANTSLTLPIAGTLTSTGNNLGVFASTTSAQLIGIISDPTGTAGKLVFSTSPTFTTSVATDSASFNVFNTTATTVNAFQAGTAISIGAASGTITLNNPITLLNQTTPSTSAITGALVVNGGVGIGLSASIGGRLQLFNGGLYTAFVSSQSGVNTTYILPPTSPSSIGASFLTSTQSGTLAWIAAPSGGSGSPGGSSGQIQYNNGGAFAGVSGLVYSDPGSGLNFVVNTPADTIGGTFGILNVGPRPFDGISLGQFAGSILGTVIAVNAATGFSGNYIDFQNNGVSGFAVSSNGKITIGNNVWSLPTTAGTSGQVLTSGGNGAQATWTTVSSSGAGSGTVAIPGAQYQVAAYYWSAIGASVSGSSTFTNNTATGIVNISHTTPSTSTNTGALTVSGSVGIGGSAFIGGQINQTFTPSVGAGIDHAVFLQSNPIATNIGALIQIGSANKWDGTTAGYFTGFPGGTFIGVNAAAGNTADLINFEENGVTAFRVGAGGTNVQFGQKMDYPVPNLLASFRSSIDAYNQLVVQNKSSGTQASTNIIVNNNSSTDTTFYGEFGMNSSNFSGTGALGAPNAVYLASASGPLVLGTTTAHPIRFTINGGASDALYISESGLAISCFANFGLRSASDLRFWNSGNTFYAGIQGGNTVASYILSMPTANVGAGASAIITGSDGQMYFVAPGGGIAFSSTTGNLPALRAKRSYNLVFCSGYTPTAAGADISVLRIPESPTDGTTSLTYNLRRFQVRVETPSAGSSRLQLERSSTDTGAFTLAATGSSHIGGLGVTITGAGIYLTSVTSFAGSLVTTGNLMRLNWTLLNATHANFSVNLLLEEV